MKKFVVMYRVPVEIMEAWKKKTPPEVMKAQGGKIGVEMMTWMTKNDKSIVDSGLPLGKNTRFDSTSAKAVTNDPGTGKDGPSTEKTVTVTVSTPSLPTSTITFNASPSTICAVKDSTLSWSTSNANRCVLQYGSTEENVAVNGSKNVSPSQITSYRLWCVNDPGTGKDGPSAEKTVSVSVASPSCTLWRDHCVLEKWGQGTGSEEAADG